MFSCNLPPALLQNDGDLLHATAVTLGWNGYRNKSQHRKLTLEKKILPPLLHGDSNPRPFNHESGALPLSYPVPHGSGVGGHISGWAGGGGRKHMRSSEEGRGGSEERENMSEVQEEGVLGRGVTCQRFRKRGYLGEG